MSNENTSSTWGPEMNAQEHIETYKTVITGAKYACGIAVLTLVLMAIFLL